MLKYLCNECGYEFFSDEKPGTRVCPECESTASDHLMLSFTDREDHLSIRGELSAWDA